MRMWLVNPALLCDKHLLGEHVEMHMFAGTILKGTSIRGYVEGGLVETDKIGARHDALADEMQARGMHHRSPLAQPLVARQGQVCVEHNLGALWARCPACRDRQRHAAEGVASKAEV